MRAADVMSTDLATVAPEAGVADIVKLLMERHVSAVLVVEDGKLVGIVSEGDLVRRRELGTDKQPSWWLQMLASSKDRARDYLKSHGRSAADIMTRDVVTVGPGTELSEIATLLERNHIKRVPVVEGGKLVGIVSRADLVRGLAAHKAPLPRPSNDDGALRDAVLDAIRSQAGARLEFVNVIVTGGVVHLWGGAESREERDAVRLAAEGVAGADKVVDHMGVFSRNVRAAMWGE